jgi:hypothetical protein
VHTRAARVLAGTSAVFWLVPFFGLPDLLVIVRQDPAWLFSYLLELGWGLLLGVLVGVPLLVAAARGVSGVLVAQLAAVALAVALAAVLAGYPRQLVPALLLAVDAGVLARLGGVRPRGLPLDRWLRLVVVAGAVLGGGYAAAMLGQLRAPVADPDVTNGLDHRQMQVALGLAVVTVGAVAVAALGGRAPGWRVPVWTLAAAVAALGAASVAYPALPGSAGSARGWAMLAWSVLLVVVAEARVSTARAPARP